MRLTYTLGTLSLAWILLNATPAAAQTRPDAWGSDFDAALAEAKRLDRPLLVHFYADWCAPCRQMEQSVLHQPRVQAELQRSVVAVKINLDHAPHLGTRYSVEALPMDLYLEPNGQPMFEATGYRSVNEYVSSARRAATKYSDLVAQRARKPSPPIVTGEGNAEANPPLLSDSSQLLPMLDGYCAVTLWKNRKWEKGSPQFRSEFRSQVYQFASAELLAEFDENPGRYAPRFLGCDAVVVHESDRAVQGSTRYGAFYDDELYLFVDNSNRQEFKADPDRFIKTRVVLQVDQIEPVIR